MQRSAASLTVSIALAAASVVTVAAACAQPVPGPAPMATGIDADLKAAVASTTSLLEQAQARQREARIHLEMAKIAAAGELRGSRMCSGIPGAGPMYRRDLAAARLAEAELARDEDEIEHYTRIIAAITTATTAIQGHSERPAHE